MLSGPPYNEQELLLRIAQADERAFTELVNRWWQPVLQHALTYLKSPQQAEEATLDIMEKIWHKRALLPEVNNFKDWIYIISRNELISRIRKKTAFQIVELVDARESEDVRYPGTSLALQEMAGLIDRGLLLLTPQQRQIFELSRKNNRTHQEIADQLGLSRQTVKGHIVNALNTLRLFLRDQGMFPAAIIAFLSFYDFF